MFGRKGKLKNHTSNYATCADFRDIFTQGMDALHLLAFLLTADHAKAEQCFLGGLEDSINGNPVFRQWARSWSKRAIIKRAIKMLVPAPSDAAPEFPYIPEVAALDPGMLVKAVTALAPFSRFVFVMAVLEGYSITECALLLGCTRNEVKTASSDAIRWLLRGRNMTAPTQQAGPPITWQAFLASA